MGVSPSDELRGNDGEERGRRRAGGVRRIPYALEEHEGATERSEVLSGWLGKGEFHDPWTSI